MVTRRALALAAAALLCCTAAFAAQTVNSASGYAQAPNAKVLAQGTVEVSGAYVRSEGSNELLKLLPSPCDGNGFNLRASAGVSDRVEVGLGYLGINKDIGDAHAFTVAGKVSLYQKPESKLAISAGAAYRHWSCDMVAPLPFDGGLDIGLPSVFSMYLVADKGWDAVAGSPWSWVTTVGVVYDSYSSSQQGMGILAAVAAPEGAVIILDGNTEIPRETFVRPFLAVEASKGDWSVLADFKPRLRKSGFTYQSEAWSLAVRKTLPNELTVTAGVTNFNLPYTDSNPGVFVDLSYKFNK